MNVAYIHINLYIYIHPRHQASYFILKIHTDIFIYSATFQHHLAAVFVFVSAATQHRSDVEVKKKKKQLCNFLCYLYTRVIGYISDLGTKMWNLLQPKSSEENFTKPLTFSLWSPGNVSSHPFKCAGFSTRFFFPWPFFILSTLSFSISIRWCHW